MAAHVRARSGDSRRIACTLEVFVFLRGIVLEAEEVFFFRLFIHNRNDKLLCFFRRFSFRFLSHKCPYFAGGNARLVVGGSLLATLSLICESVCWTFLIASVIDLGVFANCVDAHPNSSPAVW